LKIMRRYGRIALILGVLMVVATGCMPRGGVTNPGWTVVAVEDNKVYAALATGQVVCLDAAASGSALWSYPADGGGAAGGVGCGNIIPTGGGDAARDEPLDAVYGIPVLTDDLVLVSAYDGGLYALDRETGQMAWDYAVPKAIIGGVTVYDGVAYFGSSDHNVYALDLETQKTVWSLPFATENWIWGAPAVDAEHVYVGSMDHWVYAVDRVTGDLAWKRDLGASIPGNLALDDGTLFAGAIDRRLHAIDTADGSTIWQSDVLGGWVWGQPAVVDGYVYFTSLDGGVHSADVANGTQRWPAVKLDGAVRAGPAVLRDMLIVGTEEGSVYRVDMATGDSRQSSGASAAILSRPAVDDGIVYVGTTDAKVQALNFAREVDPFVWTYPQGKK